MVNAVNAPPLEAILRANELARQAEFPAGADHKPQFAIYSEPVVDAAQLAKAWQTVTLRNFSETGQTFVMLDRKKQQKQIRAGESAELQLENDRISRLLHLQRGDRGFYPLGSPKAGQPFERHPLRITSVTAQADA
jgi:hypothetical protein